MPVPLHVGARGSKRDLRERGTQGLEGWAWVGTERTGVMVAENARQRERTDLSVPDAMYEGDMIMSVVVL